MSPEVQAAVPCLDPSHRCRLLRIPFASHPLRRGIERGAKEAATESPRQGMLSSDDHYTARRPRKASEPLPCR